MLATWGTSTGRNPTLDLQFAGATSLDNRITFSRGSQATLFDSTGTLVYAKHNLLTYSEDFANADWSKVASTVSANTGDTTAPDGTSTADKLQETTASNFHIVQQSSLIVGTVYTISVFLKKAERDFALVSNGANHAITVDLVNGTASNATGTTSNISIVSAGNDWYRVSFTVTAASVNLNIYTSEDGVWANRSYVGTDGSGIYIWGAQLNLANMEGGVTSSLSTYYPTTTAAYYAPRFDYDPSTLAPLGLLIEEQRTNSIRNNTMQGAVAGTPGTLPTNWLYGQVSTLTTEIVGTGTEAGVAYVDVRISGTLTGSPLVYFESNSTVVATDAQTWATSFFVKLVGGSTTNISSVAVRLRMSDSGGVNLGFLTGSAITLPTSSTSLSACRFSAALTTTNASTAFVMPALTFSATGAIDITLRIGLPQLELGAFATSVIPTTTTALTRSADVASMTGTNFSSWFNAAEGTVYAEATTRIPYTGTNLFPRICEINDSGLTTNAIRMLYGVKSAETDYIGSVSVSGVAQYSSDSGESNGGRQIIAYKTDDFSAASNGTLLATDTSGTLPVVNTLFLGSYTMSGVGNINGTIKKIAYYPVRLPNSTLQALTA